jgi:D-aminopeptidase
VTVVLPHRGNLFLEKVPAAIEVINGYGKTMGSIQVNELGTIETPIALTSTLSVGRVADGLVSHALSETPEIGIATSTVNPVVGECSDSFLNDMQGRHVHASHVLRAIESSASGRIAEGSIGAGTSSRQIPSALGGWFIGVLVLSNFGQRRQLVIDGIPVGRLLDDEGKAVPERGSIMIVVATNAPLSDRQLRRVARRAGFGLARTGSVAGHGSGDVVIAFSNHPSVRVPHYGSGWSQSTEFLAESGPDASSAAIDALFTATIEATEEAILNSLFTAETVTGRDGHRRDAIPVERVLHIMQRYRNA